MRPWPLALAWLLAYLTTTWLLSRFVRPVWSFVIKQAEPENGEPGLVTQFDTSPLVALLLLLPLAWWTGRQRLAMPPSFPLGLGLAGVLAYAPSFLSDLRSDVVLIRSGASEMDLALAFLNIAVRWCFAGLLVALTGMLVWALARLILRVRT